MSKLVTKVKFRRQLLKGACNACKPPRSHVDLCHFDEWVLFIWLDLEQIASFCRPWNHNSHWFICSNVAFLWIKPVLNQQHVTDDRINGIEIAVMMWRYFPCQNLSTFRFIWCVVKWWSITFCYRWIHLQ